MMQSADGIEFAEHIGFQKSSPLTRIFNLFIQHITESGIMSRITSKKKYSKQLNHRQADQKLIEPIEVSQIFTPILMIITSVSVSFMIMFTERIFHKRNTNNK
ncbi:hypothetical protein GQR58_006148 [Nymphon striatum]|nr:hypothetical protein GQR58_006148 [Nymphon striatum]